MSAEDSSCRSALCRDVERDRDEYAEENQRLRLELELCRSPAVGSSYPQSCCSDMSGPHGTGGECVMPAGHHHRDGLGNEWPVIPPGVIRIPEGVLVEGDAERFAAKMREILADG